MAHAENETTINRSPEDVYAFLADGLKNVAWRSGVQSIALKSGSAGAVGALYSQTLTGPGGRSIAGDYEITAAETAFRSTFADRPTSQRFMVGEHQSAGKQRNHGNRQFLPYDIPLPLQR